MKTCTFCGDQFSEDRPYDHCTKQECVDTWLVERRSRMAIDLIPKSGFRLVYRE